MIEITVSENASVTAKLSALRSQIEAIKPARSAFGKGSGPVNAELQEIAFCTDSIRKSLCELIGATILFADDCAGKMSAADRRIANSINGSGSSGGK